MGVIVLCVDSESLRHPQLMGLDDVSLEGLPWLSVFTDAQAARDFVKSSSYVDEVWVVSSDDVSPINLAAALKHDNPRHCVYLVTFKRTGSLISCMRAAGITGSLSRQGFSARFARERQRRDGAQIETSASTNAECKDSAVDRDGSVPSRSVQGFADDCDEERYILKEPLSADAVAAYEQEDRPVQASDHEQDVPENKVSACARRQATSAVRPQTVKRKKVQAEAQAPQATEQADPQAVSQADPRVASEQKKTFDKSSAENATDGAQTSDRSYGASTAEDKLQSRGSTFVLSVVSGSGGVGRSTIAALSAFCAQRRGYRTLLLDCDLQFGDLHYFMGIDSPVRVEDILNDPLAIQSLNDQGDSPALVASLGHLEDADSLARRLPRIIDMLSEHFDVIVVNTGASWAEQHAVILECSSCALFLVDQRASSVRSCRRALDLCKRCGIATGSFAYAVNHCCRGALLTSVDVSCALQGVHVFELKDGGSIVEELLGAGMVFELVRERNDLCESIERMLDELLPSDRLGSAATAGDTQRMSRHRSNGSARKTRRAARNRGRDKTPPVQSEPYDMGQLREMHSDSVGTRETMSS